MASNREDPLTFIYPSTSSPIAVSDGDNKLLDPVRSSQFGSASGSFQNEGFLGGVDDAADSEFGFSRPDFGQSPLVGNVQHYDRHVYLCYKDPKVWPPRIEAAEFDRLPRLLSAALVARKADVKRQTLLTICEGHDGTETSNGDVLIFPDMIRYRRLTHFDVDTFVEEVLVKDSEWLPGTSEALKGWYIFVCSHGSRHRKCGLCGPAILNRFKEEIELHDLQGKVYVSPCSHIGGHKYAGNVIFFGPNIDGEVTGHWYGYVMPDDVPVLLEQHIGKGEIVDWLWRGQMGLSEEDQKKSQELRLEINGGTNGERDTKNMMHENESSAIMGRPEAEAMGCCQANGDSACCQNALLKEKNDLILSDEETKLLRKKSVKKQISRSNRNKKAHTRRVCSMPTWFESWEREDTYAALAVLSAVVSVAFSYSCYKQLQ